VRLLSGSIQFLPLSPTFFSLLVINMVWRLLTPLRFRDAYHTRPGQDTLDTGFS
jgi:hypothetical protein